MSQSMPSFWDSPFFVPEPDNWHLTEDAPEDEEKEDCGQCAIGMPVVCEFGEYGSQSRNNINYSFCIKLV